jgi:hypothetical protein
VVGFLPPFLKLNNSKFSFIASHIEFHVPPLYSPECLVFKFYGKMTSFPID